MLRVNDCPKRESYCNSVENLKKSENEARKYYRSEELQGFSQMIMTLTYIPRFLCSIYSKQELKTAVPAKTHKRPDGAVF